MYHTLRQSFPSFFAEYVKKYATEEALQDQEELSSDTDSMSDFSEDETQDMEL